MDTQSTVVVGGNVQGDITSCKVEDVVVAVSRKSAFSFTEVNKHQSYNVCTRQLIKEYDVPSITGMGLLGVAAGIVLFIVIIGSLLNRQSF